MEGKGDLILGLFREPRGAHRVAWIRLTLTLLLSAIYLGYLVFVIAGNRGPVDYETFMRLGTQLAHGAKVYGENSFYPLPYVGVFAAFSLMPRPVSLALWLGGPVLLALVIARFRPWALAFAPVFSHFVGGQSSVVGLLGFFGYRTNLDPSSYLGGVYLSLTCLKPQLAIVPVGFAAWTWFRSFRSDGRIPRQFLGFAVALAVLYLPAFILRPTWLHSWLSVPRPVFGRAISGAIPRLLLVVGSPGAPAYWAMWLVLSVVVVALAWRLKGRSHPLDVLVLLGFIISPLVHDYDLIQILPLVWGPLMPAAAVVLSLPGWWTVIFQYANDAAWVTFTVIAPGLLLVYLLQCRRNLGGESDRCGAPSVGDVHSDDQRELDEVSVPSGSA